MNDFTKIKLGLDFLIKRDDYLLENKVSERAITHKLGEYYQYIFDEWNVDCEYNLNLRKPADIKIKAQKLLTEMASYIDKNKSNAMIEGNEDIDYGFMDSLKNQLSDPKRIKYSAELDLCYFLLDFIDKNGQKRVIKKLIFPDIIVHHRGTINNNIVFEAKRSDKYSKKAFHTI